MVANVSLKSISALDLELLLAWAQISEVWKYLPTSRREEHLTWEKHLEWWIERDAHKRCEWMIMYHEGTTYRRVGVIHAESLDQPIPEVGLYVGEVGLWGRGIGREALKQAMFQLDKKYEGLQAVIHPKNRRSIRLFTGLGFSKVGKARKGQDLYGFNYSTTCGSEETVSEYQTRDRLSRSPSSA